MTDPYKVLGVAKNADSAAIRKAYKKLARQWHPDVNKEPRAEGKFKEVNAAYDILGDEEKRKLYDEFGDVSTRPGFDASQARAWKHGGGGGGFGGFGGGGGFGGVDMEDLLGSLFGGGGGPQGGFAGATRPRRGPDQQAEIRVDFLTTVLGGEQAVSLRRPDGSVETLRVPIPPGANDGGRVRLKGQGLPPRGGGPCGDLLIQLQVREHPLLKRSGDDLEMEVPLTIKEALVGGSITVPTPTGDVKVTVPKGVRSGTRLRLKDRGVQKKPKPGHLYLILRPVVPESEDPAVVAAAEVLEAAYQADVRAELKL